ncbi:MAG: LysR family transcriptional regulator, partial [Clostridia bacterium]|nr:LysR family transcriptional regulator [Clostridia bacterium]
MDTVKCRALLEALRLGSFSAAAEELGYTASGLAKVINSVEQELGVAIVKRTNRGIELTEDGKLMMPVIQSLANDHERAFQISSQIKGLTVGTINIGAYYSIAASWLPEIVKV